MMLPIKTENFAKVEVTSADDLRDWLEQHHGQSDSVWLVTYKSNHPDKYVDRWAVLERPLRGGVILS